MGARLMNFMFWFSRPKLRYRCTVCFKQIFLRCRAEIRPEWACHRRCMPKLYAQYLAETLADAGDELE